MLGLLYAEGKGGHGVCQDSMSEFGTPYSGFLSIQAFSQCVLPHFVTEKRKLVIEKRKPEIEQWHSLRKARV